MYPSEQIALIILTSLCGLIFTSSLLVFAAYMCLFKDRNTRQEKKHSKKKTDLEEGESHTCVDGRHLERGNLRSCVNNRHVGRRKSNSCVNDSIRNDDNIMLFKTPDEESVLDNNSNEFLSSDDDGYEEVKFTSMKSVKFEDEQGLLKCLKMDHFDSTTVENYSFEAPPTCKLEMLNFDTLASTGSISLKALPGSEIVYPSFDGLNDRERQAMRSIREMNEVLSLHLNDLKDNNSGIFTADLDVLTDDVSREETETLKDLKTTVELFFEEGNEFIEINSSNSEY